MTHFVIDVWELVRGQRRSVSDHIHRNTYKQYKRNSEETLASCSPCSPVPVSSYACLRIAGYETGHTLPSSSPWEVASNWERGGGGERGEITSNLYTRILRHWVKKQMLWSSISQRGGLCFGWRASDNGVHWAVGVWKMAWKMKGLFFLPANANEILCLIRDSRQVWPSLLWARSHPVHEIEGCCVIVYWSNSYSDSLKRNRWRQFFMRIHSL